MTFNELLNEEAETTLFEDRKGRKAKKKEKKNREFEKRNPKELPGRERLISAVANMSGASRSAVASYVYKMYKAWDTGAPEAAWIKAIDKKARALGFNPNNYNDHPQTRGKSAGVSNPGQREYAGRAYFFSALMNGFAKHFNPNIKSLTKNKNKKQEEK